MGRQGEFLKVVFSGVAVDVQGVRDDEYDDELLDAVHRLSRLSDRQLLERIARAQVRMEMTMSAASEYMTAALESLDTQLSDLQYRLQEDNAELQAAVEAAAAGALDTDALVAAASKVQATAELVATLSAPSVVVDPETPDEVAPIPPSDEVPTEEPTEPVEETPIVEGDEVTPPDQG